MGKGKRYNGAEHKLNIKKVIAVIIALLVIIMFAVIISKLLKPSSKLQEKTVAKIEQPAFCLNRYFQ